VYDVHYNFRLLYYNIHPETGFFKAAKRYNPVNALFIVRKTCLFFGKTYLFSFKLQKSKNFSDFFEKNILHPGKKSHRSYTIKSQKNLKINRLFIA